MSLMSMNRAIKKYGVFWGVALAALMLVGIAFSGMGGNVSHNASGVAPKEETVATVGDRAVSRFELDRRLDNILKQQQAQSFMGPVPIPSETEKARMRYLLLNQVKQEQAMVAAAKKAGVTATDAEIAREREKVWQQNRAPFAQTLSLPATATDAEIDKALNQQDPGMTITRLKQERIPDEAIRLQLYQNGLIAFAKQDVKATEADVRRSYNEIQVRHILIKSGEGGLSDTDAKAKAEKLLADIKTTPAKLASLAAQFSDDPGSKAKGGFYDWAPAGQYVPEFTNAALEAGVGKVYQNLVKTQFGYHIIKLENERPGKDLPKDFDKEKQKYIDQYIDRIAQQKAQSLVNAEMVNVKTEITDPVIRAAQIQDEASKSGDEKTRNEKLEAALAELAKVKPEADTMGTVALTRASIYSLLKKKDEAIAAYEEALKSSNSVETRLALAQLYIDNKNLDGAKIQLGEAEKLAVTDVTTQDRIGFLYEKAGDKEKSKAARAKAMDMMKRMIEMQKAQQSAIPGNIPGAPPVGAPPVDNAPPTNAPPTNAPPTNAPASSAPATAPAVPASNATPPAPPATKP